MSADRTYASPPCGAHEVDPACVDPVAVDPAQARDVARWRQGERARLAGLREAPGPAERAQIGAAITEQLRAVLAEHLFASGLTLSGYWPIGREPDLRPLLADLHNAGVTVVLPVVETRAAPLVFRRWTPKTRLIKSPGGIPAPPPDAEALLPDVALAPCLGWDDKCNRLGWGGGYFDRTLSALSPRPFTIGIALAAARVPTIFPQTHDVPLDLILTETGIAAERSPH